MDFLETISRAQDAITVARVYGEPYERDGVVVIPAARVSGGGGTPSKRALTRLGALERARPRL